MERCDFLRGGLAGSFGVLGATIDDHRGVGNGPDPFTLVRRKERELF